MSKEGTRISQCMIVKNEEKNIERALSWGRSVMWEQIVVDTGSTDRTVEIAREMGATVCEFEWIDDFSAAKNYAIEQCTGDWIALLDADEYMVPEDVKKLPDFIEELYLRDLDGLSTGWQQLNDEGKIFSSGTQVRIFRNLPDIRYRRRIHEQLESNTGRELRLGDAVNELSIFHTGYQKEALGEKKRSGRNMKLILKELKNNPEDYEMMGYLGDEYQGEGDKKMAIEWFQRSIEYMPDRLRDNDQRSAVTFTSLMMILTGEGSDEYQWREAEQVYGKAVKLLPQEADFDYIIGHLYAATGRAEQAISHLETAIHKLDTYGCNNKALHLSANLLEVYEILVKCCYMAGQKEKCMNYGITYLKYKKFGASVLTRLFKILLPAGGGNSEEANRAVLEFFSKIYDFSSQMDRLFLVKTAQVSGCKGFVEYAAPTLLSPEERKEFGFEEQEAESSSEDSEK